MMCALQVRRSATIYHKPPCGPKRGHGLRTEVRARSSNRQLAEELGLDPADIRMQHLAPANSVTANTSHRQHGLGKCIEKVVEVSKWREKYEVFLTARDRHCVQARTLRRGASDLLNNMPHSGVQLRLTQGVLCVMCAQMTRRVGFNLAYIVAEVLGIAPSISASLPQTQTLRRSFGELFSRVTLMTGNAALQAAERARELLTIAVLKASVLSKTSLSPTAARSMSKSEVVDLTEAGTRRIEIRDHRDCSSYSRRARPASLKGRRRPFAAYSYSAAVAEVDVDLRQESYRRADMDRPRHRPSRQSYARHGPGRGQRVYGVGRR